MSETFDFDSWIAGATVAEASVDIFQDASILAKYGEWSRRYARVSEDHEVERSAGEQSVKAALEAEGEALLERMRSSKTVWFVRALTSEDELGVIAAHPLPKDPRKEWTEPVPVPVKGATEKQAEAFVLAFTSWSQRKAEFEAAQESTDEYRAYLEAVKETLESRGAEKLVRAFKRIERGGEVLTDEPLTVEQVKRLPAAIGEMQFGKLIAAIDEATTLEPEIPAGFLSKGSISGRG